MLADTSLQSKWKDSFAAVDRASLDDKENRDSHKQALADAFNDYDTYNYANRTFVVVNNNRADQQLLDFHLKIYQELKGTPIGEASLNQI